MAISSKEIRITTLLVIDVCFFFIELIIGYMVNSLALIADSFHMLNDIISLVVALWAVNVAKNRSADADYTYGWLRAEILGALINAVFLIALCFTIFIEAIQRLLDPPVISNPKLILIVGGYGLLSNIVGLFLFHEHDHSHGGAEESGHSHSHGDIEEHGHSHSQGDNEFSDTIADHEFAANPAANRRRSIHSHPTEQSPLFTTDPTKSNDLQDVMPQYVVNQIDNDNSRTKNDKKSQKSLNMQGVFLHVLGDALGNVGVMLTAFFIWKTDYSWKYYSDPVISLVITCIIFSSAVPLCKRSSRILLQGTPLTVETSDVIQDILQIPTVLGVHDFHIWNLTEKLLIASLHVELDSSPESFLKIAAEIKLCLHDYGIHSATIQPEFSAYYSKQHMLPHAYSSSQDLTLHNDSSTSINSTFNISSNNGSNDPHAPVASRESNNNHNAHENEIHCLIDASANCTTADCIH